MNEIQWNFYKLNNHYPEKKLQLLETLSKKAPYDKIYLQGLNYRSSTVFTKALLK